MVGVGRRRIAKGVLESSQIQGESGSPGEQRQASVGVRGKKKDGELERIIREKDGIAKILRLERKSRKAAGEGAAKKEKPWILEVTRQKEGKDRHLIFLTSWNRKHKYEKRAPGGRWTKEGRKAKAIREQKDLHAYKAKKKGSQRQRRTILKKK